jgi:Predicted nucleic acid-binding protein, contains PIN domain
MMLIDTSILVQLFRDRSGKARLAYRKLVANREYVLSRLTQLELMQGCKSPEEWEELDDYLGNQAYVELKGQMWPDAARMYFDLRRSGRTVRSVLDCCIAQIAIERRLTLVHNDRDYETIARERPLRQSRIDLLA